MKVKTLAFLGTGLFVAGGIAMRSLNKKTQQADKRLEEALKRIHDAEREENRKRIEKEFDQEI